MISSTTLVSTFVRKDSALRLIAVGCVLLAGTASGCGAARAADDRYVELQIRSSVDSYAQLYVDVGEGFTEQSSMRRDVARSDSFNRLRFQLPRAAIERLRLDPIAGSGTADVTDLSVTEAGRTVATIASSSVLPLNDIASVERHSGYTRFVTTPAAVDPVLLITVGCLPHNGSSWLASRVSAAALAALSLVLVMVIGAAALIVVRTCCSGCPERRELWLWSISVFLIVWGAKLWLIRDYGSSIPFWDQWNAEAGGLYIPFSEGCLTWQEMLSLHNEHRIFFTRTLNLLLLLVNGQWDAMLQMIINAGLHAAIAVLMLLAVWRTTGCYIGLVALAIGAAYALPFPWENTLGGFQSAFYFVALFALLTLWLMVNERALSVGWLLGWLCSLLALVTVASGLLIAPAIIVGRIAKSWRDRGGWRDTVLTVLAASATFGLGWALMSAPLGIHEPLIAKTQIDFLTALGRNLGWPLIDKPWIAPFVWLPFLILILHVLFRRRPQRRHDGFILALGAWLLAQAVALAYARGAGGQPPASRYMDMLALGTVVNFAAGALIVSAQKARVAKTVAMAALMAWCGLEVFGYDRRWPEALGAARGFKAWHDAYERNVRAFLETDDLGLFIAKQPQTEVPFWSASMLANAWLRHPAIRGILPVSVRLPLPITLAIVSNEAFVRNGYYPTTPTDSLRPAWGSFSRSGNLATGRLTSDRVACTQGQKLVFEVAGYLDQRGLSLMLDDTSGVHRSLIPKRQAREEWIPVITDCPRGPFTVTALDDNPSYWFAFRDPVEAGRLWVSARDLIEGFRWLLLAGTLLAAIALRVCRTVRDDSEPPVEKAGGDVQ